MPTWEFALGDTSGGASLGSNQIRFYALAGRLAAEATEANSQTKVFSSYTWANLYVRVRTKTFVGNVTIQNRIGGVTGNMLATLTGTGVFQDTVNTDSLVSGNLVGFQYDTPTEVGKTASLTVLGSTLQDTSTNATLAVGCGGAPLVAFGLTRFTAIGGFIGAASALATTETTIQYTLRRATTFTNLRVRIATNNINTGTSVWSFRIDVADGAQTLSINAAATGAFEDTTNSDAVSAGSEVNTQVITSGASGNLGPKLVQLAHISTGREVMTASNSPGATSTDQYYGAEADQADDVTESNAQIAARAAFTASNLFVNVTVHGASSGADIFLRQNGGNSALTVNVPASTTGLFENTADSVSIAVADTYNYFLDHGGGAGGITPAIIGFANGPTDAIGDLPQGKLNVLLRM